MQTQTAKNVTYTEQLRQMEVGKTLLFPPEKLASMKAIASSLGFMLGRRYTVHRDRERRVVEVSRVE